MWLQFPEISLNENTLGFYVGCSAFERYNFIQNVMPSYQFFHRIRHMLCYLNRNGYILDNRHNFLFVHFIVWLHCVPLLVLPIIGCTHTVRTFICHHRCRCRRRLATDICGIRTNGCLLSFIDSLRYQQQCTQINYCLRTRTPPYNTEPNWWNNGMKLFNNAEWNEGENTIEKEKIKK